MNLIVNMLIDWQESQRSRNGKAEYSKVERILWINPSMTELIIINIYDPVSNPCCQSYEEVEQAVISKEAVIVENDPYSEFLIPEDKISEKHRNHRDTVWQSLASLIEHETPELLLYPWDRAKFINDLSEQSGRSKVTIRKYLRRWWQTGRIRNAFLPYFSRCGAPGKRREVTDRSAPKLGRPSALAKAIGHPIGIRVTPDVERRFKLGIEKFHEISKPLGLEKTYEATIAKYFPEGFVMVDGKSTPIIPPQERRPSFHQFRHWYETVYRDEERKRKAQLGEGEFNRNHRPLLSDSTQMAFGPGFLYQIDATIADIYLVNSLDRTQIIGRPVVYIAKDVFSRVIPGFSVSLEGPSWLGAMLALDNIVTDKVNFCAEFGITIDESEWPCRYLPEAILADRGEFEGYNANNLVKSLGVRVHNTSPYRADEKGIVERAFRTTNEKIIRFVPGFVPRLKTRGGPDYVLDATLTLNEFRELLIYYVLDYNMNHYLKSYRKDVFMIADHVGRYPLDIWNWGIRNRSGHLGTKSQEIVRLNILPRKRVSVTRHGIHFGGKLYYTCDLAIREGWFIKSSNRSGRVVEIAYDPRTTDYIYLPIDGEQRLETCHLTPASKHLSRRDLYEVDDYFAREKLAEEISQTRTLQSRAQLHVKKDQVISEATEKTQAALAAVGHQSKSARKRGIRANRAQERHNEREQNAWRLSEENVREISTELSLVSNQASTSQDTGSEEYIPPSPKASQIRNIRDKRWKSHEKGK